MTGGQRERYRRDGWVVFERDARLAAWAKACQAPARRIEVETTDPYQWRCARTWFAGVNILPNDAQGALSQDDVPPLAGEAVDFIASLGFENIAWDRAQLSIVYPGYPQQGPEETAAAARYRRNRDAAHVDGLERVMPGRRRRLSETHSFLLGIPLDDTDVAEGAFVIWRGSHAIMRAAFAEAFAGLSPSTWKAHDITDVYAEARKRCFETCERVEIAPGVGACYVMHPLALHGVAPWRSDRQGRRAVVYFRPDCFGGDPVRWLNA